MLFPPKSQIMGIVILTCEHGGNEIPQAYLEIFRGHEDALSSHKGWDIGALILAKQLSVSLDAPLYYATTSRLLVELNRSLHHPNLFSKFTKSLPISEKLHILKQFYHPYRTNVEAVIQNHLREKGKVIHISVHSFTPVWDGQARNADIGLLYDPTTAEKGFCYAWKKAILALSHMKVRLNYPYKGTADGFTTYLRKQLPKGYMGVELEVNQKLLLNKTSIDKVEKILAASLNSIL